MDATQQREPQEPVSVAGQASEPSTPVEHSSTTTVTAQEMAQAVEDRKRRERLAATAGLQEPTPKVNKEVNTASVAGQASEPSTPVEHSSTTTVTAQEMAQAVEDRKRRERLGAAADVQEPTPKGKERVNTVDVIRSGKELEPGEFIVPRSITQAYDEKDGKFFARDTARLMFHDQGEKLATSTTDKKAIADMVEYAKAKQWDSLKLTGSQEFRREAWLQAESQGIKTQGYTPKEADLAALKTLTQERATNTITPMQQRAQERQNIEPERAAPRHDLNKNQAAVSAAVQQNHTANIAELQKKPEFERYSASEVSKIAFYRAVLMEREKDAPADLREEAIANFDEAMKNPKKVAELPEIENVVAEREQTKQKSQEHKRDDFEQSL